MIAPDFAESTLLTALESGPKGLKELRRELIRAVGVTIPVAGVKSKAIALVASGKVTMKCVRNGYVFKLAKVANEGG